jgi:WhiB family redox-sensing transcriptional regulator
MVANRGEEMWQARAACRGPHAVVFFPPSHVERKDERTSRERAAKGICTSCPVEQVCLEYALRIREPHGIWGGLNEAERKHILDRTMPTIHRVQTA